MSGGPSNSAADGEVFDGFKFRIVALGETCVGKTSLIRRYTDGSFSPEYKQTIGSTFSKKDVVLHRPDGHVQNVRLIIWDMGGQTTYRELRRQFIKGASGALLIYDVTRPETFMAMNNWYSLFREICPESPLIICANKVDLSDKRMVPVEPGLMLRDWFQSEYYETSAKTGQQVETVFTRLAEILVDFMGGSTPMM